MTAGGRELGARRSPACWFYLAANFPDLTSKARNRSLRREGVSLFERHPPHFSTGVYNLRIKHFFGTTDNAVKTQVWIAVCVYVLVAIVRKQLAVEISLAHLLQVLSVNAFSQVTLAELVANTQTQDEPDDSHNQLLLW